LLSNEGGELKKEESGPNDGNSIEHCGEGVREVEGPVHDRQLAGPLPSTKRHHLHRFDPEPRKSPVGDPGVVREVRRRPGVEHARERALRSRRRGTAASQNAR
jgi:hypothetical protein